MRYWIAVFCVLISASFSFSQQFDWLVQSGGDGFDLVMDVAVDAQGNTYTTGNSSGNIIFGMDEFVYEDDGILGKGFLQKVNSDGKVERVLITEGQGSAQGLNIAIDEQDNVYLSGIFSGTLDVDPDPDSVFLISSLAANNLFVLKLNSTFDLEWAFQLESGDQYVEADITVDQSGNIYLGGVFNGAIDLDPGEGTFQVAPQGSSDIFLAKYNADGLFVWGKSMGSSRNDALLELVFDAVTQTILSTGYFRETIDQTSLGETVNIISNGSWDVYIQKTDLNGNLIWIKTFGGASFDTGYSLDVDDQGNIYTGGTFFEPADFDPGEGIAELIPLGYDPSSFTVNDDGFIQKLDSNGTFQWARRIGSVGAAIINAVALGPDQQVYFTGNFTDELQFPEEEGQSLELTANTTPFFTAFVGGLSPDGETTTALAFGGANTAIEQRIAIDINNHILLAGIFDETVDFDPSEVENNIPSRGSFDGYTLKLTNMLTPVLRPAFTRKLAVFPNPGRDLIHIQGLPDQVAGAIQVFDAQGALLLSELVENGAQLDVGRLPKGMYSLVLQTTAQVYTTRWIKQ